MIEYSDQPSAQNKSRLKSYHPWNAETGNVPATFKPRKRPNMKGASQRQRRLPSFAERTYTAPQPEVPPATNRDTEKDMPKVEITALDIGRKALSKISIGGPRRITGKPV